MPTQAVQFCNFLVVTNDDPELRAAGRPAFAAIAKNIAKLTPDSYIIAFMDQSFVFDDNGALHDCDDLEELVDLLLAWAQKDSANRAAVLDCCISALRNPPSTSQDSPLEHSV